MFQIAVSGQYENNKKFSDCSRHTIFPMLVEKSHKCFEEENQSFCGNYKVINIIRECITFERKATQFLLEMHVESRLIWKSGSNYGARCSL